MTSAPNPPPRRRAGPLLAVLLTLLAAACSSPRLAGPVRVVVMAYNVKHGRGMDGRIDLERIAAVIRAHEPDVVALQEIDLGCARSGGVDQARRLGELCGMQAEFGAFMPFDGGQYGMAVLSKLPITAAHNRRLPEGAEPRSALEVAVRCGADAQLIVTGIHLYRTEAERLAQAETVLALYEDEELPVLLVGDFNSRRGDAVMTRLGQHFANPAKNGPPGTFPSDAPDREIDFVLLRPAERFTVLRNEVVAEPVASDHRPVVVKLDVAPPPIR